MRFKERKPISIQGWGYVSFYGEPVFSFFFGAPTLAAYIFAALTCKATIISLQSCALNADFQHFVPRSNKIFLLERRVWGERRPKDRVTLEIILVFTLTCPKTLIGGRVNVFDRYLHWPRVGVKNTYIHCNRISVSVNHLHLQGIYTPYIQLLTLTLTRLVWTSVGWFSLVG